MTGRGRRVFFRPFPNPIVTIGLTLSTSSPTLDPSSTSPFFLVVTARILKTPHPDLPITLATHLNPLGWIRNRSFDDIRRVSPDVESEKRIGIYPNGWPHYIWDPKDLRASWSFVTIEPDRPLEIRHEVPRDKIAAAGLNRGEKYRAALTNWGLGTRWWMFGSLEEYEGTKLRQWGTEGQSDEEESNKGEGDNGERKGNDRNERYIMGLNPDDLALVIEKGEVDFEIE